MADDRGRHPSRDDERGRGRDRPEDSSRESERSYNRWGDETAGPSPRGYERAFGPHAGKGPRGYHRSDERIREDVSDRLERDPDIDANEVEVFVAEGVVTLVGTVADRPMKRLLADVVEATPGVTEVHNQVRIAGGVTVGARSGTSGSMGTTGSTGREERTGTATDPDAPADMSAPRRTGTRAAGATRRRRNR